VLTVCWWDSRTKTIKLTGRCSATLQVAHCRRYTYVYCCVVSAAHGLIERDVVSLPDPAPPRPDVIPVPQQPIEPPPQYVHAHSNPQPVSSLPGQGPTAGFATQSDEYGPLPSNWERREDQLGRNYYVDHNTRTTTWHRPRFNQVVNNAEHQQAEANQASDHHNRRQLVDEAFGDLDAPSQVSQTVTVPQQPTPSSDPLGSLPAGWEERRTPEGRIYFVDRRSSLEYISWHKHKSVLILLVASNIDNTRSTTWVDPRRQHTQSTQGQARATAPGSHLGPLPSGWEMRLTSTSRIYFIDHNTKATTWDDPRGANVPQYKRDFRRKLILFRCQPAMRRPAGNVHIKVRRNYIFEDSYAEVMRQSPNDLKKTLMITFEGEPGLDYRANSRCVASVYNSYLKEPSNVSTEFFFLLSCELFNPFYCLFEYTAHDEYTLQISPMSGVNPEYLNYFKFIGRIVGLAIFHRQHLNAYFISSFYKMVITKKIALSDLENVDAELYRSMKWMLDNDITDVIDETFSFQEERACDN